MLHWRQAAAEQPTPTPTKPMLPALKKGPALDGVSVAEVSFSTSVVCATPHVPLGISSADSESEVRFKACMRSLDELGLLLARGYGHQEPARGQQTDELPGHGQAGMLLVRMHRDTVTLAP